MKDVGGKGTIESFSECSDTSALRFKNSSERCLTGRLQANKKSVTTMTTNSQDTRNSEYIF